MRLRNFSTTSLFKDKQQNDKMKVIRTTEERVIKASMDLMDLLRQLPQLSVECDKETGISIVGDNGAIGASPDMPSDLTETYLTHQLGSLLHDE
jgi:hypothetical protein